MAMTNGRQLDRTAAATTAPVAVAGPAVASLIRSAVDADTAQQRRVAITTNVLSLAAAPALFSHRRCGVAASGQRAMPLDILDTVAPFDPNPKRIP